MTLKSPEAQSTALPAFLYGTAWKEDDTERCVAMALDVGLRGIDTANQRKHYFEAAVGEAIRKAIEAGRVRREELFLQTKFTHRAGQDDRLPYDPAAPLATQVRQSFESSLAHLHVERIDSYVLHGPSVRFGLAKGDLEVWRAMEELKAEGRTRLIGVSNISRDQLERLCNEARTPPAVVQNRCYARTGWDREVRSLCAAGGIAYQGFSLLTANSSEMRRPAFQAIVERTQRTPAQIVFRFALHVGMICLTGSTSREHLREDLACSDFELTRAEIETIEAIAG